MAARRYGEVGEKKGIIEKIVAILNTNDCFLILAHDVLGIKCMSSLKDKCLSCKKGLENSREESSD